MRWSQRSRWRDLLIALKYVAIVFIGLPLFMISVWIILEVLGG